MKHSQVELNALIETAEKAEASGTLNRAARCGLRTLKKWAAAGVTMVSVPAFAAGPDLTPLTTAIDLSTVTTAILAVSVLGIGYILAKGGSLSVMSFVRSALRG